MENFVALDFETAHGKRHSACAVGIVVVKNKIITEKFWTLIKPPQNEYFSKNIEIHGITPEMTELACSFNEIFPTIRKYLHNRIVVCHNMAFDLNVLAQCMDFYNIRDDDFTYTPYCTMKIYNGRCLKECCSEFGIQLNHHDPLSDAEACAKLFLQHIGGSPTTIRTKEKLPFENKFVIFNDGRQKIKGDVLKPSCIEIDIVDNPFKHKKVVISGTYSYWPDRMELAKLMKELGADIDSAVTQYTNFLFAGNGVGPKKYSMMNENIANGYDACILYESQIVQILKEIDQL